MDEQSDAQDQMLREFIVESSENLNIVEQQLLLLEQEELGGDAVNNIFRAIHSVKGAAGFLRLLAIERLAHRAEALLNEIREDRLEISSQIIDLLLKCTDMLKEMLEMDDLGSRCDIDVLVDELEEAMGPRSVKPLDGMVGTPPYFAAEDLKTALESHDGNCELYALRFGAGDAFLGGGSPEDVERECREHLSELGKVLHAVRSACESPDASLSVFFETILEEDIISDALCIPKESIVHISGEQKGGKASASVHLAESQPAKESGIAPPRQEANAPERAVGGSGALAPAAPRAPESARKETVSPPAAPSKTTAPTVPRQDAPGAQTIRIGVGVLDELLELIGEVVLGRNQFLHTYENDATFKNLSQSITKLHQHVIRTRMQPIGAIFEKFQRTVRDLSQKLGKKVDLHIEGAEIELDRTILEALSDPLTHLIRNAVDHGIDTLEERSALGKSTVGSIHLRAYHESGQILIEVEDDGRGIDPGAVLEKALEKGLVTPDEAKRLTEKDIIQFVFHPGFSTKSVATEVSGRGVGMDVVKTNLERLGCLVEISSRKGRGTLVSARIPLTQAIVNSSVISCLIIRIGTYTLTIPEVAVNEIIRLSPEDQADRIETVKGQEVFKLRDKVIPLVHLEDILDIPRTYYHPVKKEFFPDRRQTIAPPKEGDGAASGASGPQGVPPAWKKRRSSLIFIVLQYKQDFFGVLVDQIVGTEEIVVKRLPSIIRNRKIFGGVTILGNGTVSLILDIKGMVEKAGLHFVKAQDAGRHSIIRRKKSVDDWQEMVLFTNHDDEYFAIPVNLLSEIDRFNVKDVKQVGSKEFIQLHGMSMPLLRLESQLDVKPVSKSREMLTVLVPARVKYPSGIVANRILGTLELRQTINTQDANDKGIIGTFFDDDRMITVIDIFALMHGSDPQKYKDLVEEDIQYCRVLLAEDQLFFRQLISQYFRSFGIRHITVANDGREALDVLHSTPQGFDVVVSDIEMPNMNGYQLVSNVKSDPLLRHLPVMALTSLAGDEDIRRGLEAGFDAYEVKIDKERVIRRLNELYRKSHGKGQNGR